MHYFTSTKIEFEFSHFNRYDFVSASVVESGVLSDLWPTNTPSNIEGAFK